MQEAGGDRPDGEALTTERLPEESVARLRATVELATLVLDVSTAVLDVDDGGRRQRLAVSGRDRLDARTDALCTELADEPGPVVVGDTALDPRFHDHPCVTGEQGAVRFLAAVPLVGPDGGTVGRLYALDARPRTATRRHTRALAALAERSVDVLQLGVRTQQLERTVADLTAVRAELHRSNEELSLFAGQVSHDLRNPLTAVMANTEVIASLTADDPALLELAEAALEAGRRMDLLMRGYLAYAQVGGELDLADVPLASVVRSVVEDMRPMASASGARIQVGDLPVVRGDAGKLYAVVLNLMVNALKFRTPGTEPEVDVGAQRRDDRWRITVADRGPGVPGEDRERIFGLFERSGDPGATPGRGLGLTVVRRIVTEHGGHVGVDDRAGGGSVFWFELPG